MNGYACIIQEGQRPDGRRAELERGLHEIGRECFDDPADGVPVRWIPIRKGFGFTAGNPSTSSLVARAVPAGLGDAKRELFMVRVCDLWKEVTGCTTDEIVVTALDGSLPV